MGLVQNVTNCAKMPPATNSHPMGCVNLIKPLLDYPPRIELMS